MSYQVLQRDGSSQADIVIKGFVRKQGTYTLEASFNGGAYADIVASQSWPDNFTGTLSAQAAGQGTLTVRLKESPSDLDTMDTVGIGDIFLITGQSNAVGAYTNAQSYSHATLKACLFGNDYQWKELVDHTDDDTDGVDVGGGGQPTYSGSLWPVLATSYLADMGIPCAFVPCAAGGTYIANWDPSDGLNRATLYGSMHYKALTVGGVKAALMMIGEADGIIGTTQANFNAGLDAFANGIQSDLGIKVLNSLLQYCPGISPDSKRATINAAITEAIGDNVNVLAGPDLSDLDVTPDNFHFKTDGQAAIVAGRWWTAIKAAFGW